MRSIIGVIVLLMSLMATAQNKQLLYGVSDLPQSLLLNPGTEVNFDKHIGIPFFSGVYVSAGSSGVSVHDLFQEGGDFNARLRDIIFSLSNRDFFTINQQLELISFGWISWNKERYYSAGLYQELDVIAYFPRDLAVLGYEGNANAIGTFFDFSDLSASAEVLSVYHFGVNQKVNDKLRLGVRAKLYSSIANINSTDNKGFFVTRETPEGPNFISHDIINTDIVVNTSGVTESGLPGSVLLSGNVGFGFDIGGTYTVNDKLSVSASLIDVGVIFHSSDVENFSLSGDFSTQGIDFTFPAVIDGDATITYFQNLEDSFNGELPFQEELSESFTTFRPVKFNSAVNYGFGDANGVDCDCYNDGAVASKNNFGAQFYAIKRPQAFQSAITGYYDRLWGDFIRTKITYTVDPFSAQNLGLLLSAKINNFNVYIAGENILDYSNITMARNASVQFGFQLVFNKN